MRGVSFLPTEVTLPKGLIDFHSILSRKYL